MLQQILNDMYIDPELLQELDEEQKQMLFCKMREEQLRKWTIMETQMDEIDAKNPRPKKEGGKKVSFLMGVGDEPMVCLIDTEDAFQREPEVVFRKEPIEKTILCPVDEGVADEDDEEDEEDQEIEPLGKEEEAQLEEEAKEQTEMETDDLRKAADEELDKLVRRSRSAVQSIEETSIKAQNAKNNDPTREAVVKSLQEATLEMEREMMALEVEERKASQNIPQLVEAINSSPILNHTPIIEHTPIIIDHNPIIEHTPIIENSPIIENAPIIENTLILDSTPITHTPDTNHDETSSTPTILTGRPKITVTPYRTTTLQPIKKLNASFLEKEVPVPPQTKSEVKKANNSTSFTNSFQNSNGHEMRKVPNIVSLTMKTPPCSPVSKSAQNGTVSTPKESISHNIIMNNERRQAFANYVFDSYHYNESERELELSQGVSAQIEQFEKLGDGGLEALKTATLERAKKRRQKEILDHLRKQVDLARKNSNREDKAWREQERKAKDAERNIREIARRARAEHRRASLEPTSPLSSPTFSPVASPLSRAGLRFPLSGDINGNNQSEVMGDNTGMSPTSRPTKPPSKQAVVDWFREEELPKETGVDPTTGKVAIWFHGIISRQNAERMLSVSEVGSYLVRVSERIWGYAVSYKAPERCRHYLVDVVQNKYAFLGAHQAVHDSLGELVHFHTSEPITTTGCELLQSACSQEDPSSPDYNDLFAGSKHML